MCPKHLLKPYLQNTELSVSLIDILEQNVFNQRTETVKVAKQ